MSTFPASMLTSNSDIEHIQDPANVYCERKAIDNLKKNLVAYQACELKKVPKNNGKTIRFYVNNLLTSNTTPGSEGTPGAPITNGSEANTATLVQYFDYMSFSDFITETAISPIVEEQSREMGYRAALTVDDLTYTAFDAAATADAVSQIDLAAGEYLSAEVLRRSVMSLQARDVKAKSNGSYFFITSPLAAFDIINDNTAGGFLDLTKRNDYAWLKGGLVGDHLGKMHNCDIFTSTNVPTTSNYQSSGNAGYHTYVVGKDAFFAASLGSSEVPNQRNFKAMVVRHQPSKDDPLNVVDTSVGYEFKYVNYVPPDGVSRFRRIRAEASIS